MFLLKSLLIYLLCARETFYSKSNIVFMDQGILLYYFIHIIFYKLFLRYILTFFVLYCLEISLLLPNRICHVVCSCLSSVSMEWLKWKWLLVSLQLLYFCPHLFFNIHWCVLELDTQMHTDLTVITEFFNNSTCCIIMKKKWSDCILCRHLKEWRDLQTWLQLFA